MRLFQLVIIEDDSVLMEIVLQFNILERVEKTLLQLKIFIPYIEEHLVKKLIGLDVSEFRKNAEKFDKLEINGKEYTLR